MHSAKRYFAVAATAILLGCGMTSASDLNEVGALLVYPLLSTSANAETFVTVTNTSSLGVTAHASFIDSQTCFECNFTFPLTGHDTETLVLTLQPGFGVLIASLDGTVSRSCRTPQGMLVISLEDSDGNTMTNNLLFGEEVFVNYASGWAFSIPAIPFQGRAGNGDRVFDFDGLEYVGFPRRIAADFLAPQPFGGQSHLAYLILLTLDFESQSIPVTDCSVNGFDAHEGNFSNSLRFGCHTVLSLTAIDTEFAYPSLGHTGSDEHGWVALDCTVNGKDGGVHGSILQLPSAGSSLRPKAPGPALGGNAGWGRTLYQSATSGDATQFSANPAPDDTGWFD